MKQATKILLLSGLVAVLSCTAEDEREPVDWLLHGGAVIVADEAETVAEAMVLRGEQIVAVGSTEELRQRYVAEREIDLAGRAVVPGFSDSHTHLSGTPHRYVDLEQVPSIEEMQRRVREKAAELGEGEWVTGYGWSEDELAEGRMPTRQDLDAAAPSNPVVLTRAGAHSAVANSRALELGGFDASSPDPENGFLGRDATGELDGIIGERQDLLFALVPEAPLEELAASLAERLAEQFRFGITSVVHANATVEELPQWRRAFEAAAGADRPLPRTRVQVIWPGTEQAEAMREAFAGIDGVTPEHLRLGPIKIFVDGGFTGPAAYTKEPYASAGKEMPEGYRGKLNFEPEIFRQAIRDAHQAGWQLGIHAIGDAAIELTVAWLVEALEQQPREDHRHYLNHFTVMPSEETMRQMASHDIAITQQPNFTFSVEGRYVQHLGGERLERNNPLRTPMEHGIHVAISSDILPIGPMVGLRAAVTRQGRSGRIYAADEAFTVQEALRAMTWGGAWLAFEETQRGTLEAGRWADLAVLSGDVLAVPSGELDEVQVDWTFLAGRPVYERPGAR